jgi:predicted transporter
MNPRTARWLAFSLVGIYLVLATTGLVLQVLTQTSFADLDIPTPVLFVFYGLLGLWPLIGALIVWRYPLHPVG